MQKHNIFILFCKIILQNKIHSKREGVLGGTVGAPKAHEQTQYCRDLRIRDGQNTCYENSSPRRKIISHDSVHTQKIPNHTEVFHDDTTHK
jgi:hypothetical protein